MLPSRKIIVAIDDLRLPVKAQQPNYLPKNWDMCILILGNVSGAVFIGKARKDPELMIFLLLFLCWNELI